MTIFNNGKLKDITYKNMFQNDACHSHVQSKKRTRILTQEKKNRYPKLTVNITGTSSYKE